MLRNTRKRRRSLNITRGTDEDFGRINCDSLYINGEVVTPGGGGGGGDVTGPASSIDNNIAVFNGATGKIIKEATGVSAENGRMVVGGGVGSIDNSAAFQIFSTTGGFLPPIMNETQRDSIPLPADGLIIYNSTAANLQIRSGGAWLSAGVSGSFYSSLSTGIIYGGILSFTPGTTFNISAGAGIFVTKEESGTPPSLSYLSWGAKIGISVTNIASQNITFITIDSTDTVRQYSSRPTASDSRSEILLGVVVHVNRVTVDAVNQEQQAVYSPSLGLKDLYDSIGFISINGNELSGGSTGLSIVKTAGSMGGFGLNYFNDSSNPNKLTLPALDTSVSDTFQYRYSDGTSQTPNVTDIDPNNLDDGAGGLTAVAGNRWSVQRVYSFTSNNLKIQRGQFEYKSQAQALASLSTENFVTEASIVENGLLIGYVAIKEGTTDWLNANDFQFVSAGKFGSLNSGGSGSGTGDVIGPGTSIDNAVALFDGVTGKVIKEAADLTFVSNKIDYSAGQLNLNGSNGVQIQRAGGANFIFGSNNTSYRDLKPNGSGVLNLGLIGNRWVTMFSNNLDTNGTIQNLAYGSTGASSVYVPAINSTGSLIRSPTGIVLRKWLSGAETTTNNTDYVTTWGVLGLNTNIQALTTTDPSNAYFFSLATWTDTSTLNGCWKCEVAGRYRIMARTSFDSNRIGVRRMTIAQYDSSGAVVLNISRKQQASSYISAETGAGPYDPTAHNSERVYLECSTVIDLGLNDEIALILYQNSGGTLDHGGSNMLEAACLEIEAVL